jgi:mercuric ion transport protein
MKTKKETGILLGSFIASILASVCCIGPILFAILGISSAGIISKFEPYRGIVSVTALGLLALSFYFTYKKKPAEECKEGSLCAIPKSAVWNKRILWIATLIIIGTLTFPQWSIFLI